MIIYLTVTNDLNYDQRMSRICASLSAAGHTVVLVGRKMRGSAALLPKNYQQVRLKAWFKQGKMFYAEFNIRLFLFLLFKKIDCVCAVDLDTILPCLFISRLKKTKRVYDAHELFCEMKEVVTRPGIYSTWKKIERYALPQFTNCYTVNQQIAAEFYKMYGIRYTVVQNVPLLKTEKEAVDINTNQFAAHMGEKYILYQGAVNEGRCFETLIPAMKSVNCKLLICGEGNFMQQAKALVAQNKLENKVIFKGNVLPGPLQQITAGAHIGINLVENNGKSYYLSLANKFFDYIHAEIPQLCAGYPAYKEINEKHEVAVLITDMSAKNIATQLNNLLNDEVVHKKLSENCTVAKNVYNWQKEEKILLNFYQQLIG